MGRLLRHASQDEAERKLQAADLQAWDEYRESCSLAGGRYEEVEPWAWTRLQTALRATEARRKALKQ